MLDDFYSNLNLNTFVKDKQSKIIDCNENFAKMADLDSPRQAIGKTDFDFIWHKNAEFYTEGNRKVINGNDWINVIELQTLNNTSRHVLTTKAKLLNQSGKCIGVIGYFIDLGNKLLFKNNGYYDAKINHFKLGKIFDDQYLTKREYEVFKCIVRGDTAAKIAVLLNISPKTVEAYTEIIKRKLNCNTKGDIIATAITHGLL